jgi:enoyl-CoA hydratase
MTVPGIEQQQQGRVLTLTLNNPPYNPIGVEQVAGLQTVMTSSAKDDSVRAIVIRGAGEQHFSVGANLKQADKIAEMGSHAFSAERQVLYQQVEDMAKPVIAAIRGYCLGGGLELALAAHFRIADSSARLGLPEINLGIAPMWGGVYRTVRTVGPARGLEMLLTARHIPAQQALQWGLVNQVHEPDQLEVAVSAFASDMAARAPLAVAAILGVVNAQQDMTPRQALEYELSEFDKLSGTHDNIEGVTALFEKRKPVFLGR